MDQRELIFRDRRSSQLRTCEVVSFFGSSEDQIYRDPTGERKE